MIIQRSLCNVNQYLQWWLLGCVLAAQTIYRTSTDSSGEARLLTAIPKTQETGGSNIAALLLGCDVIRQGSPDRLFTDVDHHNTLPNFLNEDPQVLNRVQFTYTSCADKGC